MAAEDSAQPPDPVATEPGEEQPADAPTQEPAEAPAPTPGRRPGHAADWHIEPPPEVGPSIEEQLDENRKSTRPDEEKLDFLCQLPCLPQRAQVLGITFYNLIVETLLKDFRGGEWCFNLHQQTRQVGQISFFLEISSNISCLQCVQLPRFVAFLAKHAG